MDYLCHGDSTVTFFGHVSIREVSTCLPKDGGDD